MRCRLPPGHDHERMRSEYRSPGTHPVLDLDRREACAVPKITKQTVDALVPRERKHDMWVDDTKRFRVRVHPAGRKVFIVKSRHRGRAVNTTIGPHGPITRADPHGHETEIISAARTG